MFTLNIKKEALEGAIKKLAGVYSLMAKKDACVISLQAVVGKRGNEPFKGLTLILNNGGTQVASNIFCELSSQLDSATTTLVGAEFINAVNALAALKGDYTLKETESSIVVSVGDNDIVVTKKSEGVMPVDFDIKDAGKIQCQMQFEAADFKVGVGRILFAALADEEKAAGGIGIVATATSLLVRALDGVRVAESSLVPKSTTLTDASLDFVLSPLSMKQICANCATGVIVLIKTEKHLIVQLGNDLWQFPLVAKTFAHKVFDGLKTLVSKGNMSVDRNALLTALDIVDATSSAESVSFTLCQEDGKTVLYGKDRQSKATVEATVEGELPLQIAFATKLFKSCVASFKGEKVIVSLSDPVKPAVFSAEGETVFVAVAPAKL